jgi:hypothetical protein
MPKGRTAHVVVMGLGVSLAVFFAGVAAVLASGHTAPTEMWAAGSAVSGGLIGLLVPSPLTKRAEAALHAAAVPAGRPAPLSEAEGPPPLAGGQELIVGTPMVAAFLLLGFFVTLLALGVVLAAGAIVPPQAFLQSLQSVTTAIVALASASGSALIGLLAPTPS